MTSTVCRLLRRTHRELSPAVLLRSSEHRSRHFFTVMVHKTELKESETQTYHSIRGPGRRLQMTASVALCLLDVLDRQRFADMLATTT